MLPDKHFFAALAIILAAAGLIGGFWAGANAVAHARNIKSGPGAAEIMSDQALVSARPDSQAWAERRLARRFLVAAPAGAPAYQMGGALDKPGLRRQAGFHCWPEPAEREHEIRDRTAFISGGMSPGYSAAARLRHPAAGSFLGSSHANPVNNTINALSRTDLGCGLSATLASLDGGRSSGIVPASGVEARHGGADTWLLTALADGSGPGLPSSAIPAATADEAIGPAASWRYSALIPVACVVTLVIGMITILVQGSRLTRLRGAAMAEDRAVLAASNAQLEAARAFAAAKAEQLEATLAGMSDGVSMVDGHMRLVEWNARFPEISGVPAEMLHVGLPMEEMLRAQARDGQFGCLQDQEAEVERRMATLRVAPFGVVQRRRPDGHTIELRRNRLPDGGFVTLYADITDHKHTEDALRRAQAAAEAANAAKSRFVAVVSHEIRTPLNALLNSVRLLSDSVLTPAQRSLLNTARRSGEMLFALTNDILVMSQIEAGKLTIRPSHFELRPLLESCVDMFASQATERGMTFRIAMAEQTPDVLLTDPGRLSQVLSNLVSNAVKYARAGEVWLTAEPGRDPQQGVLLTVKDEGPVIALDARERLFRPFSQLNRPGSETQIGTGLGLSICHQLMELMDGEIGCDAWISDRGQAGNLFWIALPVAALPLQRVSLSGTGWPVNSQLDASPTPELKPDPQDLSRRLSPRTRILLTDDVSANLMVTATLLRRQGHHVDTATSGEAAVQAVQENPYDLIFMDIFMPGMSGQEATKIIRSLPEPICSVPIVALTANVGPEDEALFRAEGMNGMLGKPVSISELVEVVSTQVWSAATRTSPVVSAQETKHGPAQNVREPACVPILSSSRINELRDHLPPEKFVDLLELCLVDMEYRLPELRRALMDGTPSAITEHAHAMVGMAGGYGMAALEVRLRTILAGVRRGEVTPGESTMLRALNAEFSETARQLREMLRREVV